MRSDFENRFRGNFFLIALFLICFNMFLASCDSSYNTDGKHPFFVKAENFYSDGKYDEAIFFYQKYLDINPRSSKTNYRLANIFQQKKDYIHAIFYYEKYLALTPNSSDREIVKKWILASKESLASQLNEEPSDDISRINADKAEMKALKKENERLQNLISKQANELQEPKLQSKPSVSEKTVNDEQKNEKQSSSVKYYTVQEGDNFQRISRKFYGSSKYYKLIIDANKTARKGSMVLRIGEKIIIPPLKDTALGKEN